MLNQSELRKVYRIIKAYDEGLLKNPSEEWEQDHYDEPLAERKGLKPILKKIENALPKEAGKLKKGILRRRYDRFNNEVNKTAYGKIERAFNSRNTLEIGYFDMNSAEVRKRKIDVYHKTRKYVIAYCHLRKAMRKFRTSRIASAKLTNQMYNIPKNFNKNDY